MIGKSPSLPSDLSIDPLFPDSTSQPLIIAGPCSAESRRQTLETALALDPSRIDVFRAGIWKPRTFPGMFEGRGEVALSWLAEVRERTGMRIGAEVATPEHTRKLLQIHPDLIWIGARTTSNPFYIEAIAKELEGHDVAVLVKNPLAPDLNAWVGTILRLARRGVTRLAAIHRGFAVERFSIYRNEPLWQMVADLKKILPALPVIADPSHMAGRRDLVEALSLEALHRGYEGLMIETHCSPDDALSDARQQITPSELSHLLDHLTDSASNTSFTPLQSLREQLDLIDEKILQLLAQRNEVARRVGEWKEKHSTTAFQPARYEEALDARITQAQGLSLSEKQVRQLYDLLHEWSLEIQQDVMKDPKDISDHED